MADLLQRQYMSVFSDPESNQKIVPPADIQLPSEQETISFNCDDIIAAIKEIDANAASCPDDIPAKVLNKCAEELAHPISMIWNKSFEEGSIPDVLKLQFINPIFKKRGQNKGRKPSTNIAYLPRSQNIRAHCAQEGSGLPRVQQYNHQHPTWLQVGTELLHTAIGPHGLHL